MAGFTCSLLELDLVGGALRTDVRQFPFEVPAFGESIEERDRFATLVTRNLTEKGLFDGGQNFDPEFSRLLLLFGRGELSIAMLGTAAERSYVARASTDGQYAVLAVQEGQQVRFEPISPTGLVRSVVSLLPSMKPGPGSSLSITMDDPEPPKRSYRRDDEDDYEQQSWMQPARATHDSKGAQSAAIEAILRRPQLGTGFFEVTARDRNGREGTPLRVEWLDTDAGRYMIVPSIGGDGRTHVAYTPADQARIDQALTRHLQTLE